MSRSAIAMTLSALVALAAPAMAQSLPPEGTDWKAKLVAAVEAHGCIMTEDEAPFQLAPLGFEQEWTPAIVEELMKEGRVELRQSDMALVLKTENCT